MVLDVNIYSFSWFRSLLLMWVKIQVEFSFHFIPLLNYSKVKFRCSDVIPTRTPKQLAPFILFSTLCFFVYLVLKSWQGARLANFVPKQWSNPHVKLLHSIFPLHFEQFFFFLTLAKVFWVGLRTSN